MATIDSPPPPGPASVRFPQSEVAGTTVTWRHHDVRANAIRIHTVEVEGPNVGRADRPLVLFLHGFAEFWWSWRHQLVALSEAGFRAVAMDLRGYGETDKPPRGYDGYTAARDVDAVIRALGHSSATVVGHSDGGLVAWATARLQPEGVRQIAIVDSPHPRALRRAVLTNRQQRSAFMSEFLGNQLPRLAERRLTANDGDYVAQVMRHRSFAPWQLTADYADTVAKDRSAVQIRNVAFCSLEYRRWAFRSQFRPEGGKFLRRMDEPIAVPVLALHGLHDTYLAAQTMRDSEPYARDWTFHEIADAGHYPHQEQPAAVNSYLIEFCS